MAVFHLGAWVQLQWQGAEEGEVARRDNRLYKREEEATGSLI